MSRLTPLTWLHRPTLLARWPMACLPCRPSMRRTFLRWRKSWLCPSGGLADAQWALSDNGAVAAPVSLAHLPEMHRRHARRPHLRRRLPRHHLRPQRGTNCGEDPPAEDIPAADEYRRNLRAVQTAHDRLACARSQPGRRACHATG